MSIDMMDAKVKELRELRRMADELDGEIEAIQDEIKAHMTEQDTDTLTGIDWKVTWKAVTSKRLDSTALKKELDNHITLIDGYWLATAIVRHIIDSVVA